MSRVELAPPEGPIFFGPDLQLGQIAEIQNFGPNFRPRRQSRGRPARPHIRDTLPNFLQIFEKFDKFSKILKKIEESFLPQNC